jgi:hypothetical protein
MRRLAGVHADGRITEPYPLVRSFRRRNDSLSLHGMPILMADPGALTVVSDAASQVWPCAANGHTPPHQATQRAWHQNVPDVSHRKAGITGSDTVSNATSQR